MKLCRYLVAMIVLIALLFPETVLASRGRKSLPPPVTTADAYQNKPIALGATVWYCFSGRADILCLLGDGGDARLRPVQAIDARLPGLVGDILNNPGKLAGGGIRIPLHSEPFDYQLVGQLAEAVMCGSNPNCGVIFAETQAGLEALVRRFESERMLARRERLAEGSLLAVSE